MAIFTKSFIKFTKSFVKFTKSFVKITKSLVKIVKKFGKNFGFFRFASGLLDGLIIFTDFFSPCKYDEAAGPVASAFYPR